MSDKIHKEGIIHPRHRWKRRNRFNMLADWYGSERARVEISAHTRQPELISGLLDEVLGEVRDKDGGAIVTLRSQWSSIAGTFANFTSPESLKDGILTISVRHSALIMELSQSADIFTDAVNRATGSTLCTGVKFIVGKFS